MIDTIEREILIAAPIERVWEIVTTPEHMGQWFGDAGASRSGNVITMAWEKHGEADLEVVREERAEHVRLPLGRERQGGRARRSSSSRSPPRTPARACAWSRAGSPR